LLESPSILEIYICSLSQKSRGQGLVYTRLVVSMGD
jgi:hypothetical protein